MGLVWDLVRRSNGMYANHQENERFAALVPQVLRVLRAPSTGEHRKLFCRKTMLPCFSRVCPLDFEGAQHRQTVRPSVERIRSKALRPFGLQ